MTSRTADAGLRAAPGLRTAEWSTARKVLTSLGLVGAWAGLAGFGTFGTFSDGTTTRLRGGIDSGSVSLGLGGRPNDLPLAVGGLLPGGSVTRTIDLVNDGDVPLSSVTLTTVAGTSSRLDTDPAGGLQLSLSACSVPWTADSHCTGHPRVLLPSGPVVRQAQLGDPANLQPGGTDHLAVTVTLPETAGNEFAGRRSAVDLTFTAAQRTGGTR